jgi:microcystin-dependent protein
VALIGDVFSTGDGLTLGVSLVLLEIPDEPWIKASIINALNTMSIEANWAGHNGDITPTQAQQITSLMLQTIQFDYEPPVEIMPDVGDIKMQGGTTIAEGWLLCDGAAVSRTTYADLFAEIGIEFGAGNGTTTFNLPDFTERSPMGLGGATPIELGTEDGALAVALTVSQLPSHDHDYADPGHTHVLQSPFTSIIGARPTGGAAAAAGSTISGGAQLTTNTTGITFHAQGSNAQHSNLHPILGVNFMIFAGI